MEQLQNNKLICYKLRYPNIEIWMKEAPFQLTFCLQIRRLEKWHTGNSRQIKFIKKETKKIFIRQSARESITRNNISLSDVVWKTNNTATRRQIRISHEYIFHVSSSLERNAKPLLTNSMQFETVGDNRGIRKGKVGQNQPREKSGFSISRIYIRKERVPDVRTFFNCILREFFVNG